MQETWVRSLGWEDPLEEDMAVHPSILAYNIPWTKKKYPMDRGAWGVAVDGVAKSPAQVGDSTHAQTQKLRRQVGRTL